MRIALGSAKGGAGKTLMTASLAAVLAELGHSVLMIDLDSGTNGLTLLYLKQVAEATAARGPGQPPVLGIYDLDVVNSQPTTIDLSEKIGFVPSTVKFKEPNANEYQRCVDALPRLIAQASERYDFVLMDAPAGRGLTAAVAMSKKNSDAVLLVSEFDPMSAAGIERLKARLGDDLDFNRIWIVLNKVLPEFADQFSSFLEVVRYTPAIPWDADVVRAYSRRSLPVNVEKGNTYTFALLRLLETIGGATLRATIAEWRQTKGRALRAPLEQRERALTGELEELVHKQSVALRASRRLQAIATASTVLVGVAGSIGVFALIVQFDPVGTGSEGLVLGLRPITLLLAVLSLSVVALGVLVGLVTRIRDARRLDLESRDLLRVEYQLREELARVATLLHSSPEEIVRQQPSASR